MLQVIVLSVGICVTHLCVNIHVCMDYKHVRVQRLMVGFFLSQSPPYFYSFVLKTGFLWVAQTILELVP